MKLYRPIGTKELELIEKSGYKAFPPRLPDQPIFYPVMNVEYATEIAQNWNVKYNEDHKGYVTEFEVDDEWIRRYDVHIVGASHHAAEAHHRAGEAPGRGNSTASRLRGSRKENGV